MFPRRSAGAGRRADTDGATMRPQGAARSLSAERRTDRTPRCAPADADPLDERAPSSWPHARAVRADGVLLPVGVGLAGLAVVGAVLAQTLLGVTGTAGATGKTGLPAGGHVAKAAPARVEEGNAGNEGLDGDARYVRGTRGGAADGDRPRRTTVRRTEEAPAHPPAERADALRLCLDPDSDGIGRPGRSYASGMRLGMQGVGGAAVNLAVGKLVNGLREARGDYRLKGDIRPAGLSREG